MLKCPFLSFLWLINGSPIKVNKSANIFILILVSSELEQLSDGYKLTSSNQGLKFESISKSNPYNSKKLFLCWNYPTTEFYIYDSHEIIVFTTTSLISFFNLSIWQLVYFDNYTYNCCIDHLDALSSPSISASTKFSLCLLML